MKVITLCGSTRFKEAFEIANMHLSMLGNIVIGLGCFGHSDSPSGAKFLTSDGNEDDKQKQALDQLHFRKIDQADEIFVINVAGYLGSSTRREIAYAESTGKPVRYMFDMGLSRDGFQDRVAAAHEAVFGDDPTDLEERRNRHYEEANELAQALGMDEDTAHELVHYTWSRPVGDPRKEIGQSLVTMASLCVVGGFDMGACAEADLMRFTSPETIARIRAKRATRHNRGPLPGIDPVKYIDLPTEAIEAAKLIDGMTEEQHRHAQFMGGVGDEVWD